MAVLLIVGFIGIVLVLYAADRIIKMRKHARRLHSMSDRLTAASARADEQQEQHQASVQASAELTSFMPAIKTPPLTVPGAPARSAAQPADGHERTGPHEHGSARPGQRSARTGEHPVLPAEHPVRPADQATQH